MKIPERCLSTDEVSKSPEAQAVINALRQNTSDPRFQNINLSEVLRDLRLFDAAETEFNQLDTEGLLANLSLDRKILARRFKQIRKLIETEGIRRRIEEEMLAERAEAYGISSPVLEIALAIGNALLLGRIGRKVENIPKISYPTKSNTVLQNLEIQENVVSADTHLPFSEWAGDFLHGADTMLPIGALMENLLEEDEMISEIERIRWKSTMLSQMNITASLHPTSARERSESIFFGKIITSKGKKIYIHGRPIDSPILERTEKNPLAQEILMNSRCVKKTDNAVEFDLNALPPAMYSTLSRSHPGVFISTLFDLVNYGIGSLEEMRIIQLGFTQKLISGFENIELQNTHSLGKANGRLLIEVLPRDHEITLSETRLISFSFRLMIQNEIIAQGRCTMATDQL